jgi:putative hydrolase of HD superfamily
MTDRLFKQLAFLVEVDKMKSTLRQTLVMDKSRQETDAEHSWHFALAALVLREHAPSENVDALRVAKMALVHDLVEIYAGDTFAYDEAASVDKEEREREGADRLFALLPPDQGSEYRSLWEEFDRMQTDDAKYANAIDRLLPFLSNYHTQGHTWALHRVPSEKVRERMGAIRDAMPEVWKFVESAIEESRKNGWLAD